MVKVLGGEPAGKKGNAIMPHHPSRRLARDLTDAEEAEVQRRIALDPDNPELTDEQLDQMRPAREVLPPELYAALARRS
jgi:uncharacterized protein (DUF4415 family)